MNREHAQTLVEVFQVNHTLGDPEEIQLLRDGNPRLLAAYEALRNAALKSVEAGQQPATTAMPKLPEWKDVVESFTKSVPGIDAVAHRPSFFAGAKSLYDYLVRQLRQ